MIQPRTVNPPSRHGPASALLTAAVAILCFTASRQVAGQLYRAGPPLRQLTVYCVVTGGVDGFHATSRRCPSRPALYMRRFVTDGAAPGLEWKFVAVDSEAFFGDTEAEGEIARVEAGSVVLVHVDQLNQISITGERVAPEDQERFSLGSEALWALLNTSVPLIVMLDDPACSVRWPLTTHHLLYRTSWCDDAHADYLASLASEGLPLLSRLLSPLLPHPLPTRLLPTSLLPTREGWPTVRAFPLGVGTHFPEEEALFDERFSRLSAAAPPPSSRPLLFSLRGTRGRFKLGRTTLAAQLDALRPALTELAERSMANAPPPPPGIGRYVLELVRGRGGVNADVDADPASRYVADTPGGDEGGYATAARLDYVSLLRESIFTLVPPADFYGTARLWEAVEAGSLPVILEVPANDSYNGCNGAHFLSTMPWLLSVASWDEVPLLLAAQLARPAALARRQREMAEWWASFKRATAADLLAAAAAMQAGARGEAGRWRAPTECTVVPLNPYAVARQQYNLAHYWRKPQPSKARASARAPPSPRPTRPARPSPSRPRDAGRQPSGSRARLVGHASRGWPSVPLAHSARGPAQREAAWRLRQVWAAASQPRRFKGPGGWCSDPPGPDGQRSEDWAEPCLSKGCSPPLIEELVCHPLGQAPYMPSCTTACRDTPRDTPSARCAPSASALSAAARPLA